MKINVDVDMFFDRPKVLRAISKQQRTILRGTGGFYKKVVQRSMRPGGKKGRVSAPGQPPRTHTKALRKGIRFAFNARDKSVVVGALPFRSAAGKPTARELELGRPIRVRRKKKRVRVKFRPRPFIGKRSINHPKGIAKLVELTKTTPLR